MSNKISFITRFHYLETSNEFLWRFDYYKNNVLPRILNQTNTDFDIWIWCEKKHDEMFKSLSNKINTFSATYLKRDSKYFIDYTTWNEVKGLPKYNIQIGLDSDDLIEPTFVEKVKELSIGNKTIFISFQPMKLDIKNNKKYLMDKYTTKRGSPIFAFYQPDLTDFKFAYHTSHLLMPNIVDKVILIQEGYCYMSIHNLNDSTKIKPTDKRI
jgi:hypothetical protein